MTDHTLLMNDPKSTYRQIEGLLAKAPAGMSEGRFADYLAQHLAGDMADSFGCAEARVFESRKSGWRQRSVWGEAPSADGAASEILGVHGEDFPWVVAEHGAFRVGRVAVILSFTTPGSVTLDRDRMALFSALQLGVAYHLHRRELEDQLDQARAIQTSLLPASPPAFHDYDIAMACSPAHSVGGDAFDFLALDEHALGIVILDSAGHGLPAALQARDAITGIRMGVDRDQKASSLVERLNRVIYQSGLASRFVSLVIAELERGGALSYVNAGHPPPILAGSSGIEELSIGGTVLGPWPDSQYKLGFAHLDRGDSLVFFTDGVLEQGMSRGQPFGLAGLHDWIDAWREGPADRAVEDLLNRLRSVAGPEPFEDDVTVVLVRRPWEASR